ncbi:MAG TPA: glycoside hydrolase family 2 TIM barrel-domain containing protein, partial [Devosia sp.]|nr:glycoside hydrolase family 2 TIM barrel-domain containing protein [Devosia sp.]
MSESRCQFLVALDQCGLELQGPNMRTSTKRLIPARETDAAALGRDSLRYHGWDPDAVRARYEGLDPGQSYELEVIFACERSERRSMAVVAGGLELAPAVELVPAGATIVRLAVPGEAVRSGVLDIALERRSGPDAVVSELRLFGSAAVPPMLTVVGDSRGGLVGTVCDAAYDGLAGAEIVVSWPGGEMRASSGPHGMFHVPLRDSLPTGQHRELTVTARLDGLTATRQISTRALAQGLRELPVRAARLDLAGEWRFARGRLPDPEAPAWTGAATTGVPGHVAFDGLIPDGGVATLRKTIAVPAGWAGDAVFARFDGAYGRAEVFVNGDYAGTHSAGATSFDVDLTTLLRPGENDLTIVLTEYTPHAVLDYMSWYAHTSLLGLWREAFLFCVPKLHLGPTDVRLDWDEPGRIGAAGLTTDIVNLGTEAQGYRLELSLFDGDRLVHRTSLAGDVPANGSARRQVTLQVPDVEPWSAEIPRLYDLRLSLRTDDGREASYLRRIGFRRVEVRGNQLLVNGAPIRLLGVNRHDARMRTGRSMRDEDLR